MANNGKPTGRAFGYARSSKTDGSQDLGPLAQRDKHLLRARELVTAGECIIEDETEHFVMENGSADRIPYNERPGYLKVIGAMRPGDILIVWRLCRIDRDPIRMINAVDALKHRQIRLFVIEGLSGAPLDTSTPEGLTFLLLGAMFLKWQQNYRVEAIRQAKEYLVKRGFSTHASDPGYGRKRIAKFDKETGRERGVIVWDKQQIFYCLELVARRNSGERWSSIAADFGLRRYLKGGTWWNTGINRGYQDGKPWTSMCKRGNGCGEKRYWKSNYIYGAYAWTTKHLAEHGDINGYTLDDVDAVEPLYVLSPDEMPSEQKELFTACKEKIKALGWTEDLYFIPREHHEKAVLLPGGESSIGVGIGKDVFA